MAKADQIQMNKLHLLENVEAQIAKCLEFAGTDILLLVLNIMFIHICPQTDIH